VRILVVDDRADLRFSFMFMLEALGYDVAEAADGGEALRYLDKQPVDVVLTDLHMPGLDGLDLIAHLAKFGVRRPRVIAMTGSGRSAGLAGAKAAELLGADRVLMKPFTKEQLVGLIEEVAAPHSKMGV